MSSSVVQPKAVQGHHLDHVGALHDVVFQFWVDDQQEHDRDDWSPLSTRTSRPGYRAAQRSCFSGRLACRPKHIGESLFRSVRYARMPPGEQHVEPLQDGQDGDQGGPPVILAQDDAGHHLHGERQHQSYEHDEHEIDDRLSTWDGGEIQRRERRRHGAGRDHADWSGLYGLKVGRQPWIGHRSTRWGPSGSVIRPRAFGAGVLSVIIPHCVVEGRLVFSSGGSSSSDQEET